MCYLHDVLKIVHRDLKAANIFLEQSGDKEQNKLIAKIGDFGHSLNPINNMRKNHLNMGTFRWAVNKRRNKIF